MKLLKNGLPNHLPNGFEQWPEYWHPKTRRYITIKKVEFKEHHDNDVDKPKENPKPSNL